ncbi:AAA family ATPase [Thiocapsa roseopersicina]|uniref:MoxR-like ATPase n=1 Tax=Thiocapsa roseopersicina TaxID=1058 RepID=A0A1H2VMP4_THIRO|nr:MoxR family ATPase [Thiocapsa roseopersicina]SDW69645.1 MoxR-like ATPase [Thiocapsa roseopersicina]
MQIPDGYAQEIPPVGNRPRQYHVFDADSIAAIDAALAAQRPLLLRGEPGIGKSQLARAAALVLRRVYVQQVVDARTESSDLLWSYDAVARLAEAQLQGALKVAPKGPGRSLRRRLAVGAYVTPGPLWWAFDWQSASAQAQAVGAAEPVPPDAGDAQRRSDPERRCDPSNGCVVLIDEIDKAESDVPNGLLEALGAGQFRPLGSERDVVATGVAPLVIITTNEERALPDAFLRRCMVHHMRLPSVKHAPDALKRLLMQRAKAHFVAPDEVAGEVLLERAADLLIADRRAAEQARRMPLPGQAEYLDLVRAVLRLTNEDAAAQESVLNRIADFALKKHPDAIAEVTSSDVQ